MSSNLNWSPFSRRGMSKQIGNCSEKHARRRSFTKDNIGGSSVPINNLDWWTHGSCSQNELSGYRDHRFFSGTQEWLKQWIQVLCYIWKWLLEVYKIITLNTHLEHTTYPHECFPRIFQPAYIWVCCVKALSPRKIFYLNYNRLIKLQFRYVLLWFQQSRNC